MVSCTCVIEETLEFKFIKIQSWHILYPMIIYYCDCLRMEWLVIYLHVFINAVYWTLHVNPVRVSVDRDGFLYICV